MKKIMTIAFAVLFANTALAQNHQHRCLTTKKHQEYLKLHPEAAQKRKALEQATKEWIKTNSFYKTSTTVTIPVVFHVLWNVSTDNISDAQIQSQIDVLNEDFNLQNPNASSIPSAFQSVAANIGVKFCLATQDPNGAATSGITRRQVTSSAIGNTDDYYKTASGGQDAWNPNDYLNVWVCSAGDGVLGFAQFSDNHGNPSDGVVIMPQSIGRVGTAPAGGFNGRTVTHEVGHHFNLYHVWGEAGGCDEDDQCADTPNQNEPTYSPTPGTCPTFPLTDKCTTSGNGIMFNNYMDYVDDNCMNMFTNDQKARMLAAINGDRSSYKNSKGCATITNGNTWFQLNSRIDIYPNPSSEVLNINIENVDFDAAQLNIFDISGKQVYHGVSSNSDNQIDVSQFGVGTYFVSIRINNENFTRKIHVVK